MAEDYRFRSKVIPLFVDDIDTDQIIPARFLKGTGKSNLAGALFADWRFGEDGSPNPAFALNRRELSGAQVILAGRNFGCGSSREHAIWALRQYGIRAVISTSFADIFRNNGLKNGLLIIELNPAAHRKLADLLRRQPDVEIEVDLESQSVYLPDGKSLSFPMDAFMKTCLLQGVDEVGYVLKFEEEIRRHEDAKI